MNKSKQPGRSEKDLNEADKVKAIPSELNPFVERFDEGDPLHDRTPAGDSGPEDADENNGPASDSQAIY
ncbi:MAG TPA: hypothetical protein VM012_04825 [Flavitalea sp.]|nr:hypothetical protein [Flavitalea sp.]